ncbi:MAG: type III pantothenate kinase [Myxococcales bacterium]|nr:type III pantothenate kinase [Myxococcales bacterium]
MLLVIDVGNTNTVLGVYDVGITDNTGDEGLRAQWRVETNGHRTADEYAIILKQLMELEGLKMTEIAWAIASSVVPPTLFGLRKFCQRHLGLELMVVGPGLKTGMPILYENPREVGADRIVNAVAAYETVGAGCIVVDFGTATTWDVVTPKGEYLGGAIAPGVEVSSQALYEHASKLPKVQIARPKNVVGRNTEASMQSGLYYGYCGMVDSMVAEIRAEVGFACECIATGGLAGLMAKQSNSIDSCEPMLTLRGLKILFERNTKMDNK